jgi:hypothetical protein
MRRQIGSGELYRRTGRVSSALRPTARGRFAADQAGPTLGALLWRRFASIDGRASGRGDAAGRRPRVFLETQLI